MILVSIFMIVQGGFCTSTVHLLHYPLVLVVRNVMSVKDCLVLFSHLEQHRQVIFECSAGEEFLANVWVPKRSKCHVCHILVCVILVQIFSPLEQLLHVQ